MHSVSFANRYDFHRLFDIVRITQYLKTKIDVVI